MQQEVIVVLMWRSLPINHRKLCNLWPRKVQWNRWHYGKGLFDQVMTIIRNEDEMFRVSHIEEQAVRDLMEKFSANQSRLMKEFLLKDPERTGKRTHAKKFFSKRQLHSRSHTIAWLVWYCYTGSGFTSSMANVKIPSSRYRFAWNGSVWINLSFQRITMCSEFGFNQCKFSFSLIDIECCIFIVHFRDDKVFVNQSIEIKIFWKPYFEPSIKIILALYPWKNSPMFAAFLAIIMIRNSTKNKSWI